MSEIKELQILGKLDITKNNMDALAEKLLQDIKERYDVVVTEDSLPDTKKMMADINKEKTAFKSAFKNFENEVLLPLAPLKVKAKEIEIYFDNARAALEAQVKKFEAGKLEQVKKVCEAYRDELCEAKGIEPSAIVIDDLCKLLGSVTASGKISGTAKERIDTRIQAVENEKLKAELDREKLKAEVRAEIAKEAPQAPAQPAQAPQPETTAKSIDQEAAEVLPQSTDGKRVFVVTATFEVKAKIGTVHERIIEALKTKMEKAEITSLKSIEVR